ncbi:MAG: diiron oxygenase [Aureispira sp.]|nr:diiron oxygenase [Aureispira sp.]
MKNKLDIFSKWYKRAAVRSAPQRVIQVDQSSKFFSKNLAPILGHPTIDCLDTEKRSKIEIQCLYQYLQFTEYLETALVNKVILKIMNNAYKITFMPQIKQSAYKIYCDEAYHALQAHDTIKQITTISGQKPLQLPIVIGSRLEQLKQACPITIRPIFDLFFVCVAETLVSQELREHMKDQQIHESIQAIMRDHAKDEATHALFFKEVLIHLKQQLPATSYQWFLETVPKFLEAYLLPNAENLTKILMPYLNHKELEDVLAVTLEPKTTERFIAQAATQLYRILKDIEKGIFS